MARRPRRLRVVGPGRAGSSLALALGAAGWEVAGLLGRADDVADAAADVDLLVIATPDRAIPDVAAAVRPDADAVVAHLAGSSGPAVLGDHPRRAALHPLVSLPDPETGARRLAGAWFAVAGDALVHDVVADLGGRAFTVADGDRALYHAAACVAANHLVALLGQVDELAAAVGVPFEAYLDLAAGALANVAATGPQAALTGPAARGDDATLDRHRTALHELDPRLLDAYDALAAEARRLAGRRPG